MDINISLGALNTLTRHLLNDEINESTKFEQMEFYSTLAENEQQFLKRRFDKPIYFVDFFRMSFIYGNFYDFDTKTQDRLEKMSMADILETIQKMDIDVKR